MAYIWEILGRYNDYSLVTPLYNSAIIQAISAATQQAIQWLIHGYYHVLLLRFSGYIRRNYRKKRKAERTTTSASSAARKITSPTSAPFFFMRSFSSGRSFPSGPKTFEMPGLADLEAPGVEALDTDF